jgi:hypothetical protein
MKQQDIKIGQVVLTKVGTDLVRVRVDSCSLATTFSSRTRFIVSRLDNGKTLPKARTAASLRPTAINTEKEVSS